LIAMDGLQAIRERAFFLHAPGNSPQGLKLGPISEPTSKTRIQRSPRHDFPNLISPTFPIR
jgi:hypothetical protein